MSEKWKRKEPNLEEALRFLDTELLRLQKYDSEQGADEFGATALGHLDAWTVVEREVRSIRLSRAAERYRDCETHGSLEVEVPSVVEIPFDKPQQPDNIAAVEAMHSALGHIFSLFPTPKIVVNAGELDSRTSDAWSLIYAAAIRGAGSEPTPEEGVRPRQRPKQQPDLHEPSPEKAKQQPSEGKMGLGDVWEEFPPTPHDAFLHLRIELSRLLRYDAQNAAKTGIDVENVQRAQFAVLTVLEKLIPKPPTLEVVKDAVD